MSSSGVSGLASSIRGSVDSQTFDLAGQNLSTITNTIQSAFADPFPLEEMIRITFITGAGKLGRQKYDEGTAKAVSSALRELGYEEDRGASAVMECAGSFKLQHDTAKNLKTLVVFPRVVEGSVGQTDAAGGGMKNLSIDGGGPILTESTPEHSIAFSSMKVFEGMVASKCQTWTQKKGCAGAIGFIKEKVKEAEQKLMSGTALSDVEQTFYDSVSAALLDEKLAFVKEQMQVQVNDGKITAVERKALLEQVSERLANLAQEKTQAEKQNKGKRVQNLTTAISKAEERKAKLELVSPKSQPPLKHEAEIGKLRKELEPLLDLEDASKGRLLSIKETQALARKQEILEQIEQLEVASRGWFEDDDVFAARVQASESAWKARMKHQQGKTKKPATSSSTTTKWSTPAPNKKSAWGAKSAPSAAKKNAGGSVFAAMMMDSDSD